MIRELEIVTPGRRMESAFGTGSEHPLRTLTKRLAFEGGWTPAMRDEFTVTFDALAPTWPTDDFPGVAVPIADALDRGVKAAPDSRLAGGRTTLVDLGGGNGRAAGMMRERYPATVIVDLSAEMLACVPDGIAPCLQADAASLPFADRSIDLLVAVNMFLFPREADRVIAKNGLLVWVSSWGPNTPIYLSAREVDDALPGDWDGVTSEAGGASWSVHWRSDDGGSHVC